MIDLLLMSLVLAAGGALACHLLHTRRRQRVRDGLAVGQVPLARPRAPMAVRVVRLPGGAE